MARQLSRIEQGFGHTYDCKLCGGKVEQDNVKSYQAIRTLPKQKSLEHEIPNLENTRTGLIRIGTFSSSRVHSIGKLPGLYLVHRRCAQMIRHAAGCTKPRVSLLTLISILSPTAPVDSSNFKPLSNLDGDLFATIFDPCPTIITQQIGNDVSFRKLLHNLPPELLSLILPSCQAEHALAITVGLPEVYFNQVIRDDIARQRITVGIQATRLLHDQSHDEVYTEKNVKLSANMTAVFISLGGEIYLQDIRERSSCWKPSKHYKDFSLDTGPQLLALQVDHLGIRNIAFGLGKDKKPQWLRDENRLVNIFVDRVATGSFASIRIVSDPIKIRMIDIAVPDRSNHPHPRPLMPYHRGIWVPYSVQTTRKPYLQVEGYFEPSYVEFSTCKSVYLSYRHNGGICGIFNESGEGREEVPLGNRREMRTVRLIGLYSHAIPGGELSFIQIRTDDGSFLPLLPDVSPYEVIDKQEHIKVKGVWWGATSYQFYFNVVY